ncbi:nucleotide exchange factor GrpE [Ralstonia syzygii subsp. celebesensis]|uniref:Protein GrpE n=2 Tax=Ralstonia syzygii subsp. celebesensis TaxID=1310168 RepID=A0A1U9VFQ0_9RALS|nr:MULTISPECIES: nucleotide exchange factor GrpE [Ralstonia solanacearum species complex]AQW29376.1 nucleotide exchange factor GrpE [blood disease bacterium A2-HR MARDI]QQV56750.1 nucleotide exchange factor GrpE [Ralstonia syzygii subsp. celebesensis]CBJ50238.1 Hsp 24 nucleotide exchange factor, Ribulose-phosphate 3-epimerase activity [Ralstonia solanacearum PSI07]CCA79722.1 Hsp 24 nucleotide exchange factor,Ribulose-phosphate 3-epimerase activity [blood disease bacterium R229]
MKHTSEPTSQPDTQAAESAQPSAATAGQAASAYSSQAQRASASANAQAIAGDEAAVAEAVAEPDTAELRRQLEAADEKARQNYENWARAVAEGENIRRRAQDDVARAHKFAIESFAEYLLPVMDSLQAALADTSGDAAKLREGVELTLKQLDAAFEKGRVTELNPVGEKFDPHRHQAISMVPAEQEANTVVSVLQRGYTLADRVLRPALVTVAAPK